MIQPIRKRVAEANGIKPKNGGYTVVFDMNNIMKMASVDHKMNNDGKEYGNNIQFFHSILLVSNRVF